MQEAYDTFLAWCLKHHHHEHDAGMMYLQGPVYVDNRQTYTPKRGILSSNDFPSEQVRDQMRLKHLTVTWDHAAPLGMVVEEFYRPLYSCSSKETVAANDPARHVIIRIPFLGTQAWSLCNHLCNRKELHDLSLSHGYTTDQQTFQYRKILELAVLEGGKGNRKDCQVHHACCISPGGELLSNVDFSRPLLEEKLPPR